MKEEQSDGGSFTPPVTVAGSVAVSMSVSGSGYGNGLRRGRSASVATAAAAGASVGVGAVIDVTAREWSIIEATAFAARTARVGGAEIANSAASVESEELAGSVVLGSSRVDMRDMAVLNDAQDVDMTAGEAHGGAVREWCFLDAPLAAGGVEIANSVSSAGYGESALGVVLDNNDVDMAKNDSPIAAVGGGAREWRFPDAPRCVDGAEIADSVGSAVGGSAMDTKGFDPAHVATIAAEVIYATEALSNLDSVSDNEDAAMTTEDTILESAVSTILASAFYDARVSPDGREAGSVSSDYEDEDTDMANENTRSAAATPVVVKQAVKAAEITGILYAVKVLHAAESDATSTSVSSPTIMTLEETVDTADPPEAVSPVEEPMLEVFDHSTITDPGSFSDRETTDEEQFGTPSPQSFSVERSIYEVDGDCDGSLTPSLPPTTTNNTNDTHPASPATMKRSILVHHMIDLNNRFDGLEREFHDCVRSGEMVQADRVRERMGGIVLCLNGARTALALESWV